MNIFNTIVPIFTVIFIGWYAHRRGFFPGTFLAPANRIVFYIAIPAMIFRAISQASFSEKFNPKILAVAVLALTSAYLLAWISGIAFKLRKGRLGSFIQSSAHCNIGYIAFAVAYYYAGDEGLAVAGVYAGFIMILQNFYSVGMLAACDGKNSSTDGIGVKIIIQVVLNPIILSAGAGMLFSAASVRLPVSVSRSMDILGNMGLPTALLIIGASLSLEGMRSNMLLVQAACFIKLVALPAIALALFSAWGISGAGRLPILIILASPTATVAYVMAGEMGGDPDFAAAAISLCTILSSISFLFWLNIS